MENEQRSYLRLEIIWKDEHMFEVMVTASNGEFCGTTKVYDTGLSLAGFATSLTGYPNKEQALEYRMGEEDSYAYFSMKFYCLDNAGHTGVQLSLEKQTATEHRQEEKDKVALEILVEPFAIDMFQKQLSNLAKNEAGVAILVGVS